MAEYKDITILKKQISDFKKSINSPNSDYMTGYLSALSATEGIIAMLPTADVVEVKHGEWVTRKSIHKEEFYVCSVCKTATDDIWRYCPNCGAKMNLSENPTD
jgi:rubrerythrin